MSTTIDQRVVEMMFDNKNFEKNIHESMETVDKFKRDLNMESAAKSFNAVEREARKVDLSPISNACETVQVKFSALQVMAVTALQNITNQAINSGKQLIKSLSVDNISAGWEKFGDKTVSVGTLISQGYDMETVTAQLERLNWFTDETSYNFTDMVSNIAKFTASGQDLETSVTALEGIANWAALSGQNASTASRAMFQLSQAMGSGVMRKEDYKSIQNVSMDTDEFRQKALDAAVELGTLQKNLDGTYQSLMANEDAFEKSQFADHLTKDAWFTSDVMMKVFNDYSAAVDQIYEYSEEKGITASEAIEELGDQVDAFGLKAFKAAQEARTFPDVIDSVKDAVSTGWMNTFEIIFGNYEEAKALWTDLANAMYDVFAGGAWDRNEMLQMWKDLGGRDDLIQAFWDIWDGVSEVVGHIKEAWEDIFPTKTLEEKAEELKNISKAIADVASNFKDVASIGELVNDEIRSLAKSGVSKILNETLGINDKVASRLFEIGDSVGYDSEQFEDLLKTLSKGSDETRDTIKNLVDAASGTNDVYELLSALTGVSVESLEGLHNIGKEAGFNSQEFNGLASALLKGNTSLIELTRSILSTAKGNKTIENLKRTFKGLAAIVHIVKQAFEAVFNAIKPLFDGVKGLGDGILETTASWGDWLVALDESIEANDTFGKAIEKVVNFVKNARENISKFFSDVSAAVSPFVTVIKEFFESIKSKIDLSGLDKIKDTFVGIGESTGDMRQGLSDAFSKVSEFIENSKILQVFQAIWNAVTTVTKAVIQFAGQVIGGLAQSLRKMDFGTIIDFLNSLSAGGIMAGLFKMVGLFKKGIGSIESVAGGFAEMKSSVVGILNGVKDCLTAYQDQIKSKTLMNIAIAVGILAGSLLILASIDSNKLAGSLGAITVLIGNLVGAMALLNTMNQGSSTSKGGIFSALIPKKNPSADMIKLAGSVLILAAALKVISTIDSDKLAQSVAAIAALSSIMVGMAKLMALGGGIKSNGASQLIVYAGTLAILAGVLKSLADLSIKQMITGVLGLAAISSIMVGMAKLMALGGKSMTKGSVGILVMSGALFIMAQALKSVCDLDTKQLLTGVIALAAITSIMVGTMKLLSTGKTSSKGAVGLLIMAASLKLLASSLVEFGVIPVEQIKNGLIAMGLALLEVSLAANMMPKNMIGIGLGLIAVGAALEIVAHVLGKLGTMKGEEIKASLIALGGSLGILALGLNMMTGTLGGSAALIVATGALLLLVPVLKVLGGMSWIEIASGLGAIAGVFIILGVAGKVLSSAVPAILGLSASILILGVGMTGIGVGLLAISAGLTALAGSFMVVIQIAPVLATAIVTTLGVIISGILGLIPMLIGKISAVIVAICQAIGNSVGAIGEAVKKVLLTLIDVLVECVPPLVDGAMTLIVALLDALVEYMPTIVDRIFRFLIDLLEGIAKNLPELIKAAVDVIMAFFSGVVEALKGIDTEALLEGIAGVGIMSVIMLELAGMAAIAPLAMVGVVAMGATIAELALVLAAVGALAQIPGLTWLIGEGGDLMQAVGTALGQFVGGIVGGFAEGVSSQFVAIADDLSQFMIHLQPFILGAMMITPAMMDGVNALAQTVLVLTAANILDGLTSWLTGGNSISDFAKDLVPLGTAIREFGVAVKGVDGETVAAAANAGKTLAEMAATLPNTGGLAGFFAGENDMDDFGKKLVPFGIAMKAFSLAVYGLNADAVVSASNAGKALAELASSLPNSGGLAGWFMGENDIDDFGRKLVPFGVAMSAFGLAVRGLDADAVINSATAGKALSELADNLPNSGGVASWFAGENDIDTFGTMLVSFGESMKKYGLAIGEVDPNVIESSANAAKALAELANSLPNSGGVVSWFAGDNDIGTFGESLSKFGEAFYKFYEKVEGIDTYKLYAVLNQLKTLVDIVNTTQNEGGLEAFINSVANIHTTVSDAMNSVADTIDDMSYIVTNAIKDLITECLTTIRKKYEDFEKVGSKTVSRFADGISEKEKSAKEKTAKVVDKCVSAIRDKFDDFFKAGGYLAEGFANGISSNTYLAEIKAKQMAAAAATAARKELDEHSPSKVGDQIGSYFGIGFINGLAKYVDASYDTSSEMAASAKEGLRNTISKIGEFIDSDIDAQPIIRPVLDLSSAQAGAHMLSALLSSDQAMSIDANMNARAAAQNKAGDSLSASTSGNTYTFTQNNYSPKALSRIDIYRQTKNQFSALKGAVEA